MPDPLPFPPDDFASLDLPILALTTMSFLYRIHSVGKSFLHFGKTAKYRFDDPQKKYGVLYASETPQGAFIETLGPLSRFRTVDNQELRKRSITEIHLKRTIKLVDLKKGTVTLSLDERISIGDDYKTCRVWSRGIYEHPAKVDGIYYRARHYGDLWSIALFDRAKSALDLSKSVTEELGSSKSELRRRIVQFFDLRIIV